MKPLFLFTLLKVVIQSKLQTYYLRKVSKYYLVGPDEKNTPLMYAGIGNASEDAEVVYF